MENRVAEVPVQVSTIAGKQTPGRVQIKIWNQRERAVRSVKFWGGSWGFMVLSVFLPIAHFVLVPLFLVAGPVAGFIVYKQQSVVLGGEATCPQCGQKLPLVRGPDKWPLDDVCANCHTHVKVAKA